MKNFNRGDRNERKSFGKRDFGSRSMHQATCDKCGNQCEVPFRPSGGKPIFCSDCFSHNRDSGKTAGPSKEQFEMINSKLDKILLALKPAVQEAVKAKPVKKAPAKVKVKKAAKKKKK